MLYCDEFQGKEAQQFKAFLAACSTLEKSEMHRVITREYKHRSRALMAIAQRGSADVKHAGVTYFSCLRILFDPSPPLLPRFLWLLTKSKCLGFLFVLSMGHGCWHVGIDR